MPETPLLLVEVLPVAMRGWLNIIMPGFNRFTLSSQPAHPLPTVSLGSWLDSRLGLGAMA